MGGWLAYVVAFHVGLEWTADTHTTAPETQSAQTYTHTRQSCHQLAATALLLCCVVLCCVVKVTLEIGQACDFPFHILTAPHFLFHYAASDPPLSYTDAIRQTIKIGGENGDRGSFIGSLVAAAAATVEDPLAAIPATWRANTTQFDELKKVAEAIVDGGDGRRGGLEGNSRPWLAKHSVRGDVGNEKRPLEAASMFQPADNAHGPGLGNAPGCIAHGNSTTSNATRPPSHPDDSACLVVMVVLLLLSVHCVGTASGGGGGGGRWRRMVCMVFVVVNNGRGARMFC